MEVGCGRRGKWTRAELSVSPSAQRSKANGKVVKQRLEANQERRRTGNTIGGRKLGRKGSCPPCSKTGEAGKQYLRRGRWRGSTGLSLLSWGIRATIV